MATYWVSDAGDDGNDGTSYAQAKATLAAGVALMTTKGDILNVVGSFAALSAGVDVDGDVLRGTSYSDPAFIIQGTDPSGNPAECTVTATGTANHEWIDLIDMPDYGIIRGFKFDATGMGNAEGQFIKATDTGQFPVRIEYCSIIGNPAVAYFYRPLLFFATSAYGAQAVDPALWEIRYCFFQDAYMETDNGYIGECHHCVFRHSDTTNFGGPSASVRMDTNVNARGPVRMWNCTFDMYYTGSAPRPGTVFQDYNNSTNIYNDQLRVSDNLLCFASSNAPDASGQCFTTGIIGNGVIPVTGTFSGTIGYNVFYFDAGFVAAITAVNSEIYRSYYDPDYPTTSENTTGIWPTDLRVDSATISEVINSTTAWTWTDINGSGYAIDLPKDYRLTSSTLITFASDGGVVGAITNLLNAPPVAGNVTYTATSGVQITVNSTNGVLSNSSDPDLDTLTASVTGSGVSHGVLDTFNTTTGAFQYTPNITFTGTDSFSFIVSDGTTWSNTATASILVSNNPPSGENKNYSMTEGSVLSVTAGAGLLAGASAGDAGQTASVTGVGAASNGVLTYNTTTGAFTYTPNFGFVGMGGFAFQITDGNTNSATYFVQIAVNEAVTPPAQNPVTLIDSFPFFRPVLKGYASAQVRIQRNENRRHVDQRHYLDDTIWNEHTVRYMQVDASSNVQLTFGGVAETQAFVLQTDQDLTVNVVWNTDSGTDSFQATVSGCMMFDQAPITSLSVSNTSSTTANVHLTVFE